MYARNVRMKLKANNVPEFTRILEQDIIPLLRNQKGFQDEISFVAPERNEVVAISFWDKQDHAEAYNHTAYLDVLRLLSRVLDGMPVMETFEVSTSTFRRITASAG
jgi:heme-degrading monooxygenase HmoA